MRKLLLPILLFFAFPAQAEPPASFNSAKKAAVELWWEIGPSTLYCSCPYRPASAEEKKLRPGNLWVESAVCGYQAKELVTKKGKPNARAMRVEWEHVVPADWIATGFDCQNMTRKECRAIPGYKQAEGDLFNLFPAIGELNAHRSARLFGNISDEIRNYGSCDFEVEMTGTGPSHSRGAAEPMTTIRGDVARVWLYMIDRYGLKLPEGYETLMSEWSVADPINEAEKLRHDIISRKMGWNNPFVDNN